MAFYLKNKELTQGASSFKFVFVGQYLNATETPQLLKMKDGDQIYVTMQMSGG